MLDPVLLDWQGTLEDEVTEPLKTKTEKKTQWLWPSIIWTLVLDSDGINIIHPPRDFRREESTCRWVCTFPLEFGLRAVSSSSSRAWSASELLYSQSLRDNQHFILLNYSSDITAQVTLPLGLIKYFEFKLIFFMNEKSSFKKATVTKYTGNDATNATHPTRYEVSFVEERWRFYLGLNNTWKTISALKKIKQKLTGSLKQGDPFSFCISSEVIGQTDSTVEGCVAVDTHLPVELSFLWRKTEIKHQKAWKHEKKKENLSFPDFPEATHQIQSLAVTMQLVKYFLRL